MHFLVTAYDGTDDGAVMRRQKAREKHLEGVKRNIAESKHLFGAAILDEEGKMVGSMLVVDYSTKEVLFDEWLKREPYVLDNVWENIEVLPCKVPDFFLARD